MATLTMSTNSTRLKTMLIPREHGAWGMLLVPLATGAIVASRVAVAAVSLTLFVIATLAVFWLRAPLEACLGTSVIKVHNVEERAAVVRLAVVLAAIALVSVGVLFARGFSSGLLIVGSVSGLAFAAQAPVKRLGRKGRMPAQVIGAVGLTSTAAGAYYVSTGRLDRVAIALWVANWLFAADQVHYVQVRIRGSKLGNAMEKLKRGYWFLLGQIGLMIVLLNAIRVGTISPLLALAFVPALIRGAVWFVRAPRPLDVHRLGFSELAQAVGFGVLLCAAFVLQ